MALAGKRLSPAQSIFAAAALTLVSIAPVAWLDARPRDPSEVAVIFAPWTTRDVAFAKAVAAGGLVVRAGITEDVLIVHGDGADLARRLYAMGAWAVIDPVAFGGCLAKPLHPTT